MKRILFPAAPWVALLLVVLNACEAPQPFEVRVRFRDARGLDAGAPVMIEDDVVGRVTVIRVRDDGATVDLDIEPKHARKVTEDAQFRLVRERLLSPERHVELIPGDGTPVPSGTRFVGRSGSAGALSGWMDDVQRVLEDPALRREVQELGDEIDRALARGREQWEKAKPGLERDLERIMKEAERAGTEASEAVRRELERLRQAMEEDDGPI